MTSALTTTEVARRLRASFGYHYLKGRVPLSFTDALAREYRVSRRSVLRRTAKLRRMARHGAIPVTSVPVAEVGRLHLEGWRNRDLASRYGVSHRIISLAIWQAHDEGYITWRRRTCSWTDTSPARIVSISRSVGGAIKPTCDLSGASYYTVRAALGKGEHPYKRRRST